LSVSKWLLKGDATGNSFKEFTRVEGEVFVSGDYESATDNFNRYHSEAILSAIAARSRNIPRRVWDLAFLSLSGNIVVDDVSHPQIAGQLMGNLLSFPLLCLTNYLAFRYVVPRRQIPLRINGDDIVFRASRAEAEAWMKGVAASGLTLSIGKTLVHGRYFSLNSTFFEGRSGRKPSLVPVVRAKCIYAPLRNGDGLSLAARLHTSCNGMSGWRKGVVKGHILRWHKRSASSVGCSFNRALGVRVPHDALVRCGLLEQEAYYLRAPVALDKPRREERDPDREGGGPPATSGWKKIAFRNLVDSKSRRRDLQDMWAEHCLNHAWAVQDVRREVDTLLPPKLGFKELGPLRGHARRMRLSVRCLARWVHSIWRKHPSVRRWLYEGERRLVAPESIWVAGDVAAHVRASPTFRYGGTR